MKRPYDRKMLLVLALTVWAVAAAGPGARAQEAVLVHDQSGGLIDLEGETRVRVSGIQGTIAVRTGREGELRYEVRSLDNRREERPIGLWLDGRAFRLAPLEGAAEERLLLEMAVPPGLAVTLDLDDSHVEVAGLHSDLELLGGRLDIDARGIYGEVTVEVVESGVGIEGVAGDVEIDGESVDLTLGRVEGALNLTLVDSKADVRTVTGQADLDLENTALGLAAAKHGIVLQANGGSVELHDVRPDADLRLDGASLILTDLIGRAQIESDSKIQLANAKGTISITGYGGAIRGRTIEGTVELDVERGSVELEQIKGKLTISGNDLGITIKEVEADTTIRTVNAEVRVEKVTASLRIENELGLVEVQGTTAGLSVVNRDGDVKLGEIGGPLDVVASGENVEVGWSQIVGEGNQSVVNERGGVVLNLPSRGRYRIEAQSKYGTISSDIPTVRINADGRFASGVVGGGRGPTIKVRSQGDLYLASAGTGVELPTQ